MIKHREEAKERNIFLLIYNQLQKIASEWKMQHSFTVRIPVFESSVSNVAVL